MSENTKIAIPRGQIKAIVLIGKLVIEFYHEISVMIGNGHPISKGALDAHMNLTSFVNNNEDNLRNVFELIQNEKD